MNRIKKSVVLGVISMFFILLLDSCGSDISSSSLEFENESETSIPSSEVSNDTEYTKGLEYYLQEDGSFAVSVGEATQFDEIIIPDNYNGIEVTAIAKEGFKNLECLKKIVIPDSIRRIGESAFFECYKLENII